MALDKIGDDELDGDVRGIRPLLEKLATFYNAWLNPKIVRNSGKDDVTISDSNVTFELNDPSGGTGGGNATTPPLTILPAGTQTTPGRVRLVNGTLGNLLPAEMKFPDAVLPSGTDNQCYLTLSSGTNYICGKVAVDGDTGLYTGANAYAASSQPTPDDAYAYLLIGVVQWDGSTATKQSDISQLASGSQSLQITYAPDGTVITPYWSSISVT